MRHNKRGFTLLETLVVVAIILILVAISVPNLLQTQHSARRGVIVTDLQTLTDALSAYASARRVSSATLPINAATLALVGLVLFSAIAATSAFP